MIALLQEPLGNDQGNNFMDANSARVFDFSSKCLFTMFSEWQFSCIRPNIYFEKKLIKNELAQKNIPGKIFKKFQRSNIFFQINTYTDPQPTITLLIRNGFGRHAWTLQLRHLPRHRSATKQSHSSSMAASTGRPISMVEASCIPDVHQNYFPDCINRIEAYKA